MASQEDVERLSQSLVRIVGALLVAGRQGKPAEGLLPFNPLHFHMLRLLDGNGPTRPSVLAERLGVARTTISAASRSLEGRDLVQRGADPTDGRAHVLSLTPVGRLVVSAIQRQDLRNAAAMLDGMTPERATAFVDLTEEVGLRLGGVDGVSAAAEPVPAAPSETASALRLR